MIIGQDPYHGPRQAHGNIRNISLIKSVKFSLPTEIPGQSSDDEHFTLTLSCRCGHHHHHLYLFRILGLDQVLDLSLLFFTLNIKYKAFVQLMFLCLFVCLLLLFFK